MQPLYSGLHVQGRLVFSVAVLEINKLICVSSASSLYSKVSQSLLGELASCFS